MSLRIAINGYGRIGRNVVRALFEANPVVHDLQIIAVNDLGAPDTLAHLTRYDSVHGRFAANVELDGDILKINDHPIQLLRERFPEKLPWQELNIDVVLECTGEFRARNEAARHLLAGAKKVIIGAAPFDTVDATIVYGVNHDELKAEHNIISSVSCTTHCLVPLVKILHEEFGVESGLMTEIHAYTNDQHLLDHTHRDLRRARAAAQNIIPTTSSSIGALKRVLPEMADKIDGYSLRVPTANVAAVDFSFIARKTVTVEAVNKLFQQKSRNEFKSILGYSEEPLVSSDFNHQPYSLIFDALETRVTGQLVKLLAWYDNECGYANRLIDVSRVLKHVMHK
ncbi:MAG TPA: type I glyceraldehyde-3-phosphate dehydrogenase [Pseudomonadales bacterium]|nr:type I glyceraldehyde-3-phosphate dehydrogenase [Pseudomonadales bacterium]